MRPEDRERISQVTLDAIGLATERFEDANLLGVIVHLVIEDDDGDVRVVTQTWPAKD